MGMLAMRQSPEGTSSPFLLYKPHRNSLGAGFACRFPCLCLFLRPAEEETLCLGAGGEGRAGATERALLTEVSKRGKQGNGVPLASIMVWVFTFVVALYINQDN